MQRFVGIDGCRPELLRRFDSTPQRTPAWFSRRKGKVSGSKLSQILFCKTAKQASEYREELLGMRASKPLDDEALARCRWGTENEPNAIATLLQHLSDAWVYVFGSSPRSNLDGVVARRCNPMAISPRQRWARSSAKEKKDE